jgi:hypothetical protein
LLGRPKHDDGLDAKAGAKHSAGDVDVDDAQFFRSKCEIECRNVRPADLLGKQSLDETCVHTLLVERPDRVEAFIGLGVFADRLSDVPEDSLCERARTVSKRNLIFAEPEIDTHGYLSRSVTTASFRHRDGSRSAVWRMSEDAICQIAEARDYPGLRNIIPILRTSRT